METRDPAARARAIDARRAREAAEQLGSLGDLAVLLATAFPPLTPVLDWQRAAVAALDPSSWHTALTRASVSAFVADVVADADGDALRSRLRRAVWALRARIALREVLPHGRGGADVDTTARELSHVADVAFDVALGEATRFEAARHGEATTAAGAPSTLVALGMGKLGGLELNAGSDVDVNFVYDTDDGGTSLPLHEHWSRVVRRAVETMEEPTEDGIVWRVDLRLRPEGSQGPLVNSVAATERYYETWGRLWERAALLRARPMAGDLALGATVLREIVAPFVYRRAVDPRLATDLAEMVLRSRAELSEDPARDLKLGPGGLREAEFFVQALQLIWGGREPWLRVQSFFVALARLRSSGLVTDREQREILSAYWLLRRVEHAVQWTTGLQTHLLPADAVAQGHLARVLGYEDEGTLLGEVRRARAVVEEHFASLSVVAPRPPSRHQPVLAALERRAAPPEEAGLADPDVFEHLRALAERPDGLLGDLTRERHPGLADEVLDAVADAADPVQAALYLRSFFARFSVATPYVSVLASDPKRLRRLVTTLGASALVGDAVVARPDLASVIVLGGDDVGPGAARALVETEHDSYLRQIAGDADDEVVRDGFVGALRRAKAKLTVEVAVADLAGAVDTRTATRRLSELADEILERTTAFAMGGDPRGLAVIAMGKLGGRAIGYASDLDVLFVYDPDAAPSDRDPGEHFSKVAQRILRLLSTAHPDGSGYELDTRLRPSGSQGLLVTSLGAFARYHGVAVGEGLDDGRPNVLSSGAAWERQALLRARACAGDHELGARVIAVAHAAAYERGAPSPEEVHRLRLRMQTELAQEREGRRDLKAGVGGLLDVEFAVQWLQMRHGTDPGVRTTEVREALDALRARGYLAAEHHEALRVGQAFLRRLEQRIHVQQGTSASHLDERAPGLPQLARRMGYLDTTRASGVERLLARHREVSARVRAAYLGVLGIDG